MYYIIYHNILKGDYQLVSKIEGSYDVMINVLYVIYNTCKPDERYNYYVILETDTAIKFTPMVDYIN